MNAERGDDTTARRQSPRSFARGPVLRSHATRALSDQGPGAVLYRAVFSEPKSTPFAGFSPNTDPGNEPIDLHEVPQPRVGAAIKLLLVPLVLGPCILSAVGKGWGAVVFWVIPAVLSAALALRALGVRPIELRATIWDGERVVASVLGLGRVFDLANTCVVVDQLQAEDDAIRLYFVRERRLTMSIHVEKSVAEQFVAAWRERGRALGGTHPPGSMPSGAS